MFHKDIQSLRCVPGCTNEALIFTHEVIDFCKENCISMPKIYSMALPEPECDIDSEEDEERALNIRIRLEWKNKVEFCIYGDGYSTLLNKSKKQCSSNPENWKQKLFNALAVKLPKTVEF